LDFWRTFLYHLPIHRLPRGTDTTGPTLMPTGRLTGSWGSREPWRAEVSEPQAVAAIGGLTSGLPPAELNGLLAAALWQLATQGQPVPIPYQEP
jgi:hypothetical protein